MKDSGVHLATVVSSFLPYIEKKISGLSLPGLDKDDLRQEAFVALFSAIETFDDSRGTGFSTYAITCINNRLVDAVRSASSTRNKLLNESISLSDEEDSVISDSKISPEDTAILKEEYARIMARMSSKLSELERDSLLLYSSGYSYAEIAEKKNTTVRAVGNAIQRARKKLRKEQTE